MAEAMIGEIRFFPLNFAPLGWYECDGRKLSIRAFTALFGTIGFTYGGDQQNYFNIPDLRGVGVVRSGQAPGLNIYTVGQTVGSETTSLVSTAQLPTHTHTVSVQSLGYALEPAAYTTTPTPGVSYIGRYWYNLTQKPPIPSYFGYNPVATSTVPPTIPTKAVVMGSSTLSPLQGQSQPHENRQPYLVLRPCICHDGYFMPNPN